MARVVGWVVGGGSFYIHVCNMYNLKYCGGGRGGGRCPSVPEAIFGMLNIMYCVIII